jgi:biopolymer transport protein ExbD
MSRRSRHKPGAATDPELPIVPMLDMSFQLMAFFILTFRPMPSEAQLALALPKLDGGPSTAVPVLTIDAVEDEDVVIQVFAADTGNIASIKAVAKTGDVPLGTDTGALFKFLQDKAAATKAGNPDRKTPKLRFEIGERLNYQFVIKLLDEGVRAGYDRISPTLLSAGGAR